MRSAWWGLALLFWLAMVDPAAAPGQTPDDTLAHLQGIVVVQQDASSGIALEGAFLHLEGIGFATRTDSAGGFDLGQVPVGVHRATLHHPIWQTRDLEPPTAVFTLVGGEVTNLEWVIPSPEATGTWLEPFPIEGITVTVDGELLGRREEGSGFRYIGPAEIARFRGMGHTVADLVRGRFPALRSVPSRALGQTCVQARRMGEDGYQILQQMVNPQPDCPDQVPVIVDGVKIVDPSTYLATLSLEEVESVEFVPGSVAGTRFGTGFAAGALVIETRHD